MYNIETLKTEALTLVQTNQFPVIASQSDFAKAGDVLKLAKNKIKQIDEKRREYTDPLLKQQKLIKADFDQAAEPYVAFVAELENKMTVFHDAEQARLDAEQARLDAEAAKTTDVNGVLVPIVNDIKSSHGDIATTTVRKVTRGRLIDINAVPTKFLMLNEKALNAHIKEGGACPSGIEYYEETILSSR